MSERFVSMSSKQLLAIRYTVTPCFDAEVKIEAYLDGCVHNEDSNYDELFGNKFIPIQMTMLC